jgi:hypothetical protein
MDLESAASFWVLRLLRSEDLPAIAVDALEAGFDTPALRILAGERDSDAGELDMLWRKVLEELKLQVPSRPVAMMNAARHYTERIVSGDWSAIRGANAIWRDLCTIDDAPECLRVFVGLADEYDDFEYRAKNDPAAAQILSEIESQIVLEARSLLESL